MAAPGHPGHQTWQCVISSCGVSSRTMFTSHHFQRHYRNCSERINTAIGTSHKTCLREFGGNGTIAWTSAVSHVGRTSNAFKVTMKLQTFFFQIVVTSCIYVQYLWKYGFAKSSDNLYTPCIIGLSASYVTRKSVVKSSHICTALSHLISVLNVIKALSLLCGTLYRQILLPKQTRSITVQAYQHQKL